MSGWEIATLALLVGGMVPALVLVARGGPIERLVGLGLLSDDGRRVRLTRKGKGVADAIVTELL